MLTHGIQLEITRLRYSSKHDLNIYQFNYQANTRSGGFLQKAHISRAGLRSCGAQLVGCLRGPSILFIIVHKEEKNCKCKVAILNLSNIFYIYSSEIFYILKISHGGKFYKN